MTGRGPNAGKRDGSRREAMGRSWTLEAARRREDWNVAMKQGLDALAEGLPKRPPRVEADALPR